MNLNKIPLALGLQTTMQSIKRNFELSWVKLNKVLAYTSPNVYLSYTYSE